MPTDDELFEELKRRYLERLKVNPKAYEEISELIEGMKPVHRDDALKRGVRDVEQSWRRWKGNSYEKFVAFVLAAFVDKNLPDLGIIMGQEIAHAVTDERLSVIKRSLLIDFGIHGLFLPDADVIVYSKSDLSIIAVVSCKTSLRERIAQTGFWKLKLLQNPLTRHIKMFFATSDDDKVFEQGKPITKSKAIAMHELDAVYVLRPGLVEVYNVKVLCRIIEDLSQ